MLYVNKSSEYIVWLQRLLVWFLLCAEHNHWWAWFICCDQPLSRSTGSLIEILEKGCAWNTRVFFWILSYIWEICYTL